VNDIEQTCAFYHATLGMEVVTFDNGRKALKFGDQKINLHQKGDSLMPKAANPVTGAADICLISLTDISSVMAELNEKGIRIIEGPVEKNGAHGKLISVYINDPDGNLIEISNYVK
jgi:catechol 2,3-dioxygenase-like lactoylglutathione lyase family enzyme